MRAVTDLMRSRTIECTVMALCGELRDTKTSASDVATCAHDMPLLHASRDSVDIGLEAHVRMHVHNQSLPTAHRTAIALGRHALGGPGRHMSI